MLERQLQVEPSMPGMMEAAMRKIGLNALATIAVMSALGQPAVAQDKVKVGVFPTASSLPYFLAIERGFFKEHEH